MRSPPSPHDVMVRKSLRILGVLAFQCTLVFLLLEGGLRLLRPHLLGLNALLYTPSTQTDYDAINDLPTLLKTSMLGFKPNQRWKDFVLNSRSLRTKEYRREKNPGVYRIVISGDSFAFGSGGTPYDKMWTIQFERALNQKEFGEVEVLSLGVPGVAPAFELRLWELERDLLQADLVVLAFFIGNDFIGVHQPTLFGKARQVSYVFRLFRNSYVLWRKRESTDQLMPASPGRSGPRWWLGQSGARSFDHGGFVIDSSYTRDPQLARFSEVEELEMGGRRMQIGLRDQKQEFDKRSNEAIQVITRFHDEVRMTGAEFVVMIIPDVYQVDESLRNQVLRHLQLRPEDIDVDYPQRRLKALLDEHGVAYLDLLRAFRERSATERLHWLRDTHWNLEGNALAANMLARYLEANVLASEGLQPR